MDTSVDNVAHGPYTKWKKRPKEKRLGNTVLQKMTPFMHGAREANGPRGLSSSKKLLNFPPGSMALNTTILARVETQPHWTSREYTVENLEILGQFKSYEPLCPKSLSSSWFFWWKPKQTQWEWITWKACYIWWLLFYQCHWKKGHFIWSIRFIL